MKEWSMEILEQNSSYRSLYEDAKKKHQKELKEKEQQHQAEMKEKDHHYQAQMKKKNQQLKDKEQQLQKNIETLNNLKLFCFENNLDISRFE